MSLKILLVGEFCTDKYIYGKVPRLSPEAPCPVFEPDYTSLNDGMGGNVGNNIKAMFPYIELTSEFFDTGVKTRYVDKNSGYQIMRLDENIRWTEKTNDYDLGDITKYDAIIISDYNKGFISNNLIEKLVEHPLVFVDTKRTDLSVFNNAIIKINQKEYNNVTKYHTGKLIVTLGAEGAQYNNTIYPVEKVSIKDLSGAGDTFLAALALYHTFGHSLEESIKVANIAASIAVSKPGTAVVTNDELEGRLI